MQNGQPVALITGAARGLGREVARQLADQGWQVVITSRDAPAVHAAAGALGPNVSALDVALDVADPAAVLAAADKLTAAPGRLDVLVNNAAAYVDWTELASTADLDAAHAVLETNLFGAWRLTQAVLPLLRESPSPRVINVSSGAGSHHDTGFGLRARGGAAASYGISKAALNALTSTLAAELAESRILVNAVCPGLTATWPGSESMGARPVEISAKTVIWAANLPDNGPTGGFFRDMKSLAW